MGAKSRRKGAQGEREVAALARELGFADAERSAPMQAGRNRNHAADICAVGRLKVESKRYRRTPVNRFAREVLLAPEEPGFIPVLAYRDDHQPEPFAVVKLADLLKLEAQALKVGGGPDAAVEDAEAAQVERLRRVKGEEPA